MGADDARSFTFSSSFLVTLTTLSLLTSLNDRKLMIMATSGRVSDIFFRSAKRWEGKNLKSDFVFKITFAL